MLQLVLIVTLLVGCGNCNYTVTEQNCKYCILIESKIFLKVIWQSSMQPYYSCRASFALALKFAVIVDHACILKECSGIGYRPFIQPLGSANQNCRYLISLCTTS